MSTTTVQAEEARHQVSTATAASTAGVSPAPVRGLGWALISVLASLVAVVRRWPLTAVLAGQAVLSLILIARPVFQDEATYADVGNAELAHLAHGTAIFPYASFLSGAPVIYPPLSAIANGAGGLIAARLLSLAFMLAATALLYSATRRLFGKPAGLLAGVTFATTAAAQYLGALATYDALALALLAAAAWCAVRSAGAPAVARAGLLAATIALLAAADATKYASTLWNPVVIAAAALASEQARGWRRAAVTGAVTSLLTAGLLAAAVVAAGPAYQHGIVFTTLHRTVNGGIPPARILTASASWVGLVAVLALAGAGVLTLSASHSKQVKVLGWVFAAAVLLAPLNQARIGVEVSLFKHVGFGAWFAAIPAGYGLAAIVTGLAAAGQPREITPAVFRFAMLRPAVFGAVGACLAGAILAGATVSGITEVRQKSQVPAPYSRAAVTRLQPLLTASKGAWLADDPTVLTYYSGTRGSNWRNTYGFSYTDPYSHRVYQGQAAYADAIRRHYFGVVVLRSSRTAAPMDAAILAALHLNHGYRLTVIPEPELPSYRGQPQRMLVWRYTGVPRPPSLPQSLRRHQVQMLGVGVPIP